MIVKTKRYELPKKTYIKIALLSLLKEQWWLIFVPLGFLALNFIEHSFWFYLLALLVPGLYILFWVIQFTGVTQLEQGKMLFEKLSYEIDSRQVMIKINAKQGSPLPWTMIKSATKGKDHFLFTISRGQFIYLPYKIFNTESEIKFVDSILKRKNYIK